MSGTNQCLTLFNNVLSFLQFSEFPDWLNSPEAEALCDRQIVAYCTGGVRCERATGLLKARGFGDAGCWQLSNGIEGYLREYAVEKSFFLGSNFVFDERCTVKGGSGIVVGRCIVCNRHEDDYGGYICMYVLACLPPFHVYMLIFYLLLYASNRPAIALFKVPFTFTSMQRLC